MPPPWILKDSGWSEMPVSVLTRSSRRHITRKLINGIILAERKKIMYGGSLLLTGPRRQVLMMWGSELYSDYMTGGLRFWDLSVMPITLKPAIMSDLIQFRFPGSRMLSA